MNPATSSPLRFVLFATGVTAIGGFLFGYDTAVINGANSYLVAYMHLNPTQEGLAGASAILGCIPGAMCAGVLGDRFGRKKVLLACALLYAASALLAAIPRTLDPFLFARFIGGLGIGASSMICPVYIAEVAPSRWRGRLGTLFQLGIVSGVFFTLFVNKVIQGCGDEAWNTAVGWRWMLGMEFVPAALFFGLLFTVPESPRWLMQRGRADEALEVLNKIGGAEHARREQAAIQAALQEEPGRLSELLTGPYLRPLAITSYSGVTIADKAPRPDVLNTGFTVEYSLPYLQSKVESLDLPDVVRKLTPMTEVLITSPVGHSYGSRTTVLIAPGVSYAGEGLEFAVEALVPATSATGSGVGVTAQLHLALDYLLVDSILGKPLFTSQ